MKIYNIFISEASTRIYACETYKNLWPQLEPIIIGDRETQGVTHTT